MTTTGNLQSQTANFFDQWANQGRGEAMAQGHWPAVKQIIDAMHLQPGQHCLDVGCGNGYAVRVMAENVLPEGTATGVDFSPEMIRVAQTGQNKANAFFQVAPAELLPFKASRFHHLLSVEAIYYLPDPLLALQEWRRVLKPGGSVWVMVDFYRENPYCTLWPGLLNLPMTLLSVHEYQALFEKVGFTAVSARRLFNRTPVEVNNFKPGWGYETPEDVRIFRTEVGSLLISGSKP